jgi:hypothetical protein
VSWLTYRYLIFLNGNSLFGDYITVDEIYFSWKYYDNYHVYPDKDNPTLAIPNKNAGSLKVVLFLKEFFLFFPTSYTYWYDSGDSNYHSDPIIWNVGYNVSGNTMTGSLSINSYLRYSDSIYLFKYTVLMYDAGSLAADRPQYKFDSGMNDNNSSLDISFHSTLDLSNGYTDYLSGMKGGRVSNAHLDNFQLTQGILSNDINISFRPSQMYPFLAASYFAAAYFSCPGPLYILNVTNQSCQNPFECDDTAMYYNYSNGLCQPCHPLCVTCFTENECLSCNASLFR